MLLSVQIQAILFQLLAGWLYGLFFSLIQVLTQYRQSRVSTTLVEVLFHAGFTAVLFFALLQLNGACMNVWLMLFFALGALFYYRFYYHVFFHLFTIVRRYIRGVFRQFSIAKSRTLVIIKKNKRRKNRRRKRRDPDGGKEKED